MKATAYGHAVVLLRPEHVGGTVSWEGRRADVQARAFAGSHVAVTATIDGTHLDLRLGASIGTADQIWLAVDGVGVAFPA